jgi:hypothetical protein
MTDYAITYRVTVYTSADTKKQAERTADRLIDVADSGFADTTIVINEMIKTEIVPDYAKVY